MSSSGFQVFSRGQDGRVHQERWTTNEQLAKELVAELPNDPDIDSAWYKTCTGHGEEKS